MDFGPNNPRPLKAVATTINLYNAYDIGTFKDIETCFVGMQAVDKLGENVKLYSPENCFFKHYLTTKNSNMTYGVINVEDRTVTFMGVPIDRVTQPSIMECSRFSINSYLMSLISSQNAEIVSNREDADVVLVMEKAAEKNEISLIDNNFCMDL